MASNLIEISKVQHRTVPFTHFVLDGGRDLLMSLETRGRLFRPLRFRLKSLELFKSHGFLAQLVPFRVLRQKEFSI